MTKDSQGSGTPLNDGYRLAFSYVPRRTRNISGLNRPAGTGTGSACGHPYPHVPAPVTRAGYPYPCYCLAAAIRNLDMSKHIASVLKQRSPSSSTNQKIPSPDRKASVTVRSS